MIKRYCDYCKNEIIDNDLVIINLRCFKFLGARDIKKEFHSDCARKYIGEDICEKVSKDMEERRLALSKKQLKGE